MRREIGINFSFVYAIRNPQTAKLSVQFVFMHTAFVGHRQCGCPTTRTWNNNYPRHKFEGCCCFVQVLIIIALRSNKCSVQPKHDIDITVPNFSNATIYYFSNFTSIYNSIFHSVLLAHTHTHTQIASIKC